MLVEMGVFFWGDDDLVWKLGMFVEMLDVDVVIVI